MWWPLYAPVAQRIRASVFGTEGRGFESLPVYQVKYLVLLFQEGFIFHLDIFEQGFEPLVSKANGVRTGISVQMLASISDFRASEAHPSRCSK
jgi:hypothetical protein